METLKSTQTSSPVAEQEETPAQLAARVKGLEARYAKATGIQERIELIYDLVSVDSPEKVDAIGRIFASETNQKLKIELINSLSNIEGENRKKLAILTDGVGNKQTNSVRIRVAAAIVELSDKRGVPLLKGMLGDSDKGVRQSAEDGLEQLQADLRLRAPQLYEVPKPMNSNGMD